MLIERVRALQAGAVIPKPEATADFRLKGWGRRRGGGALIYRIPDQRSAETRLEKRITVTEFARAYEELELSGQFTRSWFNLNLPAAANEGGCNYTTFGGVFSFLGLAKDGALGEYTFIDGKRFCKVLWH